MAVQTVANRFHLEHHRVQVQLRAQLACRACLASMRGGVCHLTHRFFGDVSGMTTCLQCSSKVHELLALYVQMS